MIKFDAEAFSTLALALPPDDGGYFGTFGGRFVPKWPTHQELASMVGTSRETVSRVLSDFVRSGFVTLDGKRFILHDEFIEAELPKTDS